MAMTLLNKVTKLAINNSNSKLRARETRGTQKTQSQKCESRQIDTIYQQIDGQSKTYFQKRTQSKRNIPKVLKNVDTPN